MNGIVMMHLKSRELFRVSGKPHPRLNRARKSRRDRHRFRRVAKLNCSAAPATSIHGSHITRIVPPENRFSQRAHEIREGF